MLEKDATEKVPTVMSLDSAFEASKKQGAIEEAEFLLDRITRLAKSFVNTTVEATEAPIVVPD